MGIGCFRLRQKNWHNFSNCVFFHRNGKPPVRSASQNSLKKPLTDDPDDDDKDSLDDYGEDSKFNEDGSFIGQYGDEEKNTKSNDKNGTIKVW